LELPSPVWKRGRIQFRALEFAALCSGTTVYSSEKIVRDVPAFRPQIALEDGIARVLDSMESAGCIPDSDTQMWKTI
jgi:hypothetical protein